MCATPRARCECACAEVDLAAARERLHVARHLGAVETDDDIVEALAEGALHARPRGFRQRLRRGALVRLVWPWHVHVDAVLVCEQLAIMRIERIEVAHSHGQAGLEEVGRCVCTRLLGLRCRVEHGYPRHAIRQPRELLALSRLSAAPLRRPVSWIDVGGQRDLAGRDGLVSGEIVPMERRLPAPVACRRIVRVTLPGEGRRASRRASASNAR
jgi:hypothetical protein